MSTTIEQRTKRTVLQTPLFKAALSQLQIDKGAATCDNDKRNRIPIANLLVSNSKKDLLRATQVSIRNDVTDHDSGVFVTSSEESVDHEGDCVPTEGSACSRQISRNIPANKLTITIDSCASKVPNLVQPYIESFSSNLNKQHAEGLSKLINEALEQQACLNPQQVQKVVEDIDYVMTKHFSGYKIKLYGSYLSGFSNANSNINLELFSRGTKCTNKIYRQIATHIEQEMPEYRPHVEEALNPRDSFVSLAEPELGTDCEVRHLGENSNYYRVSNMMMLIISLDPRIRKLMICFRHWAEVCFLNDADNGRLQPLSFALMVVYYLQRTTPPILPIIDPFIDIREANTLTAVNQQTVEELWLGLVNFYGFAFNWRDHVISIIRSGTTSKEIFRWKKCWIGIESPYDVNVNIAKSVTSQDVSFYIQQCFRQSYQYFANPTNKGQSDNSSNSGQKSDMSVAEYNFTFSSTKLTEGILMPSFCPDCTDLGYTCPDCIEEGSEEFEQLPPMTSLFLKKINAALEGAYATNAIQEQQRKARINFVSRLEALIQKEFHDAKLHLVGSSMNGFGFHSSDLDVCMTFHHQAEAPTNLEETIRRLCFHLRRSRQFSSVIALYSAKIPVVQFHHRKEDLRGDISLYNLLAVENTKLLRCYSKIDERAKVLGCAMKLLAKNAGIADTSQRSLSSYSYIIMVIHYLQQTNPPVLPVLQELCKEELEYKEVEGCDVTFFSDLRNLNSVWQKKNHQTVEELWLGLIRYYTEDLDSTKVITIHQKEAIHTQKNFARLFNIQDPFIKTKNLGYIMSEEMSVKTWRTLLRARKLFGVQLEEVPSGFNSLTDFFFHSQNLTDGRMMKAVECPACGKLGHTKDTCKRFNWQIGRGTAKSRGRFSYRS